MLRGMTARQFMEWRAYADLEPFDEERADLRTASIVQAVLNGSVLVASHGKKPGRVKLKDCVLRFGTEAQDAAQPAEKRREQIKGALMQMAQAQKLARAQRDARRKRRKEGA